MTRNRILIALVSCLALAPLLVVAAESTDRDFVLDSRVTLDAYRATVEARLDGVLAATRTLAATEEVRSGEWARMRGPLVVLAANTKEHAAVWFAQPDGSYFTAEKGPTGETLHERSYFPTLLAGRDVVGALVISKSTGKRSLIIASPVLVDGKVAGAVGVSMDATKLAASVDQAIRFPTDVVFYALDQQGQTALHRAGDLIFVFPSDVGSVTLGDAVKTMLSRPEGVVHYQYSGSDKTAVFQRSQLTGWVFVLGKSYPSGVKPRDAR
jgi:methyl-accepting chemotaxis protein